MNELGLHRQVTDLCNMRIWLREGPAHGPHVLVSRYVELTTFAAATKLLERLDGDVVNAVRHVGHLRKEIRKLGEHGGLVYKYRQRVDSIFKDLKGLRDQVNQ